jgi:methionine sulfoxide reductase heme-binding subunit
MAPFKSIWDWDIVKWIMAVSVLLLIANFSFRGFNEDSVRSVIAGTARVDVVLFCLAFGATSLHKLLQNSFSFWLMMNRKYWGISFALLHIVHLLFLIILQQYFHPVFTLAARFSLFAGGMAYVFIILMLLTSFDTFSQLISKTAWQWLHLIGGHWIWLVFMSSYWKRVLRGELAFLPLALLLVLVMILRVWAKLKKRGGNGSRLLILKSFIIVNLS